MNTEFIKLEKKILKLWYVISTILFILSLVSIWGICLFANDSDTIVITIPSVIIGGVLSFVFLVLLYGYPSLLYRSYSYYYNDDRIIINKGVFFKHHIVVPVCQIQDLHIYEGPLMQIMKLDGIIISTAGSNYIIKGLSRKDSEKMIESLEANLRKRLEELKDEKLH